MDPAFASILQHNLKASSMSLGKDSKEKKGASMLQMSYKWHHHHFDYFTFSPTKRSDSVCTHGKVSKFFFVVYFCFRLFFAVFKKKEIRLSVRKKFLLEK